MQDQIGASPVGSEVPSFTVHTVRLSLAAIREAFSVLLTRGSSEPDRMTSVRVALSWNRGMYPLTLPTVLVEDRRDKTEVQVVP